MYKFMLEKEKLQQIHEGKKSEVLNEYRKEMVRVEKEYDAALAKLIGKYAPCSSVVDADD